METVTLKASPRKILGKKIKAIRREGQIPAILYGRKFTSAPLTLSAREFVDIAVGAREATIINLEVPSQPRVKVLIRDIQRDPVTDNIVHVDFYKLDMKQEIQTDIPLEFIGTAPAVEELEGNLITNKDSIKAECLPDRLVSKIEVDVSALKTFEDLIHVGDLNITEGIKVLDDKEDVVAQVTPPRSEEELAELEAAPTAAAETEKAQIETMEAEAAAKKTEKSEVSEEGEITAKEQNQTSKDEKK